MTGARPLGAESHIFALSNLAQDAPPLLHVYGTEDDSTTVSTSLDVKYLLENRTDK